MTTVAILQPGYLPWLGFFNQMLRSDIFVVYDDVQYDKHGWRNRNRIKSASGPLWLTVPVLNTGFHGQKINEARIDNRMPWGHKHINAIAQNYAKAPYLGNYLPEIRNALEQRWDRLIDLDMAMINLLCRLIGIQPRIEYASALGIEGDQSQRLLNICNYFGASHYLSGDAAQSYLDLALFESAGVEVIWHAYEHPQYPQLHGQFVPYLSVVDLLMNVGKDSVTMLKGQ